MRRRTRRASLPVLFRADRRLEHGRRWITAVFPTLAGTNDPDTFTIYQHIGQHGSATRGWYGRTRAAAPAEYADLLAELRSIYGSDRYGPPVVLRVMRRFTRAHDGARRAELARMRIGR